MSDPKYLTSDAAEAHMVEAFRHFVEARRDMTIFGFSQFIRENIGNLGGRGFLASVGAAISAAAEQSAPETATSNREHLKNSWPDNLLQHPEN